MGRSWKRVRSPIVLNLKDNDMNQRPTLLGNLLLVGSLSLTLCGCGGGGSSGGGEEGEAAPRVAQTAIVASSSAASDVTIPFVVSNNSTGAQLVTFAPGALLQLTALRGPGGNISLSPLLSGASTATSPAAGVASFALPLGSTGLESGNYQATFALGTPDGQTVPAGTEIRSELLEKSETDLSFGRVRVNLFLVGPVAGSEDLREDLSDAAAIAADQFANRGLQVDFFLLDAGGPETLPDPRSADPFYTQLSLSAPKYSISIAIGSDVDGLDGEEQRLSISAGDGVPGIPSSRSVSALSLRRIIGSDGRFNFDGDGRDQVFEDEVDVASEEIAQLVGHALSLQHPIEFDGDRVIRSDNLADTGSCITFVDCREDSELRENLMFPELIAVPNSGGETYRRRKITEQQASIMHRSVLVD